MLIRGIQHSKNEQLGDAMSIFARLDPLGTTLSFPGLVLLIYSLTSGNIIGWKTGAVIGTLVAAVILLVTFVVVEAKVAQFPLVPRQLWSANIAVGCALAACTYAVWQGANYFLTLELQGLKALRGGTIGAYC